jgi:hypothetical protein
MESAGGEDVKAFLTHLASVERVTVATQKQALHPVRY